MKNNLLIHKNSSYEKIIFKYIIALMPLIIYGFYKNGLLLYINKTIGIFDLFKPILFPLIGAISGLVVSGIRKKKISFNPLVLYGVLIGMMMPINCNLIVFFVSIILLLLGETFIENKVQFNYICLIKLIIILLLIIFGQSNYANVVENTNTYSFSFIDLIFGRQIGGICSSSFFWTIIGLIYLCTDYYYKKDIPLVAYLTYIIIIILSYIFNNDLAFVANNIVASAPLFAFVFIAPISVFSPYTKRGKMVYSILIGLLSALLTIIGCIEASLIAILIMSFTKNLLDMNFGQKNTK